MAMFERSTKYKIINSSLILSLIIAATCLLIILVWQLSGLKGNVDLPVTKLVHIGPLALMEVEKKPVEGGYYSASIQYLPGIIGYLIITCIGAGLLSWIRIKKYSSDSETDDA